MRASTKVNETGKLKRAAAGVGALLRISGGDYG